MAETATPLRTFSEDEALEWLRAQPGGRTNMPAAELGRRWGWHRQRVGRCLTRWAKAGLVTLAGDTVTAAGVTVTPAVPAAIPAPDDDLPVAEPGVTVTPAPDQAVTLLPPVTPAPPAVTPGVDAAAYAAAVALAGVAAVFSIRGMLVLFPGAPQSVVAMAVTMEAAKLVTTAWLAARWSVTPWLLRGLLGFFIVGIAAINGAGVFSQLVSAHVGDRATAAAAVETHSAEIAGRLELAAARVADLDRRLGQIDTAIETAAKSGRTQTALAAIQGQRQTRAALAGERERAAAALAGLKAERAQAASQAHRQESEAAPIRYVAEMLGAEADSEKAIRWLIALMVMCCDPLAIVLTAAASRRTPQ